ncbi:hypothetical protein JTB14_004918 [Gonioctena quinquepunctata]|nr:hypothetical protein JTB14_004918 [Gonioctena quinquepunctata]
MDSGVKKIRATNPRQTASIFSIVTFFFTYPLYKKSRKKILEDEDIYEVVSSLASQKLGNDLENQWSRQTKKRKKPPSLALAIISCFGLSYVLLGLVQFVVRTALIFIQPIVISRLVAYFQPKQETISKIDLYQYAAMLIGLNFLTTVYNHNYEQFVNEIGIKVRTAVAGLVYRKALRLTPGSFSTMTTGKIVTLITKDVFAFENALTFVNDMWIGVIQTGIIGYLIYQRIGISVVASLGFYILTVPLQFYVAKKISQMRIESAKKTDERIQMTTEILSAIKIIKMYTWEAIFGKKITELRKGELRNLVPVYYLKCIVLILASLASNLSFFLLIMIYVWTGHLADAETVSFIQTLFERLKSYITISIPYGIAQGSEVIASLKRLDEFLGAEETKQEAKVTTQPKVYLDHVSVAVKDAKILKDEFDEKRYNEVLRVCALQQDLSVFGNGDQTIVGDKGVNLSKGQQARISLARAVYRNSDIYLLDDCFCALDNRVNSHIFRKCVREFLKHKIVILVTNNVNHIKQVYGANTLFIENGSSLSLEEQKESLDKRITYFMDDEDLNYYEESNDDGDDINYDELGENKKLLGEDPIDLYHEKKLPGKVSFKVYFRYFKFAGGVLVLVPIFTVFILCQVAQSFSDKLFSKWVNTEPKLSSLIVNNLTESSEYDETNDQRHYYLNIYSVALLGVSFLTFLRVYLLISSSLRASRNLHKSMSNSVVNSYMTFFDTHYLGNIVNRFSKDLNTMDEMLPISIYEVSRHSLSLIGVIVLMATVDVMLLFPAAILLVKMFIMRRIYIKIGRNMKRLDSATRSPMIGYLNASLEGLIIAKAHQKESLLIQEFDRHQDLYTSAYYMMICATRAFAFTVDLFAASFVGAVVLKLVVNADFEAGSVGMVLALAMGLSGLLQWAFRQYSELENNMTSIERVLEYTDIKTENKQMGQFKEDWPNNGVIEFKKVSLAYGVKKQRVLKDISFVTEQREKIGIVGRTGAGKTSIISTLFRLYQIEGNICIDGVDIKTISLELLRSSLAIIPQDPILFSGTIRSNIDPNGTFSDEEIWKAIEKAHLKNLFSSLQEAITENGSNYSSGQKQLLCMARALVSRKKIVILDEATASMDPETCRLLQSTIRKSFDHCTVLTIAHRLNTVADSDRILVVDDGEVVEFDTPSALLANTNSLFYNMMKQSGQEI